MILFLLANSNKRLHGYMWLKFRCSFAEKGRLTDDCCRLNALVGNKLLILSSFQICIIYLINLVTSILDFVFRVFPGEIAAPSGCSLQT